MTRLGRRSRERHHVAGLIACAPDLLAQNKTLKAEVEGWKERWALGHKRKNIGRWDRGKTWDEKCPECAEARKILEEK